MGASVDDALISRLENEGKPVWAGDSVAPPGEPELFFDDLLTQMVGRCPAGETCNEFRREELKKKAERARALGAAVPLFEIELTEGATIGEYDFKKAAFPVNLALRLCNTEKEAVCLARAVGDPRKPEFFSGSFTVPVPDRAEAEYVAQWRDDPRSAKRVRVLFTLTGKVVGGRVEASLLAVRVFGHRFVTSADAGLYETWVLLDHFPPTRK